jgi:hypothetical protein
VRALIIATFCGFFAFLAYSQLDGSYTLPLEDPAIDYAKAPVSDPVWRLKNELESGKRKLAYDPDLGYLPSLLAALKVPESSQVLVFSKTSFQAPRISPRTPRAIYFNDAVTVGYVKGGDVLELTAQDARQGTIFYTLDQEPGGRPALLRRDECLQCHLSGRTSGVPGLIVRSVYPDSGGMPIFQAGGFMTDHRSPLKERWGGWYVTGRHGSQQHMGNTVSSDRERAEMDYSAGQNMLKLDRFFNTGAYLTPHSDIAALMVLEHEARGHNLITRVGWETRMALTQQAAMNGLLKRPGDELSESTTRRIHNLTEHLVQYLLFKEEAPITEPISGTSGFAEEFSRRGPLYELDLKTRLFRRKLSFLVYGEAFDALPEPVLERFYMRLNEELKTPEGRETARILRATKPRLHPAFRL